jgi:hypothetical protein
VPLNALQDGKLTLFEKEKIPYQKENFQKIKVRFTSDIYRSLNDRLFFNAVFPDIALADDHIHISTVHFWES